MTAAPHRTRRILCFGDSNTWGSDPETHGRLPRDVRWTGVLAAALGGSYEIIEEGLRGRTTVHDDPLLPGRNASRYLAPCIGSHQPLDAVVIMLGTNDLKNRFRVSANEIAVGVKELIRIVRSAPRESPSDLLPAILIVSPPVLGRRQPEFSAQYEGADDKSKALAAALASMAATVDVAIFDAGTVVTTGDADGVQLAADQHGALGAALAPEVEKLFSPS